MEESLFSRKLHDELKSCSKVLSDYHDRRYSWQKVNNISILVENSNGIESP